MIARFVYAYRYFRRDLGLPLGRALRIGRDPETGAFTITRGNAVLTLAWSDA